MQKKKGKKLYKKLDFYIINEYNINKYKIGVGNNEKSASKWIKNRKTRKI